MGALVVLVASKTLNEPRTTAGPGKGRSQAHVRARNAGSAGRGPPATPRGAFDAGAAYELNSARAGALLGRRRGAIKTAAAAATRRRRGRPLPARPRPQRLQKRARGFTLGRKQSAGLRAPLVAPDVHLGIWHWRARRGRTAPRCRPRGARSARARAARCAAAAVAGGPGPRAREGPPGSPIWTASQERDHLMYCWGWGERRVGCR
jgi:hypothetical protein